RGKHLCHLERARDAKPRDLAGRPARNVALLEKDAALARAQVTRDHVDEGGLAGAVRPDDSYRLLGRHIERDVPRGNHRAKGLLQVAHGEDWRRWFAHGAFSCRRKRRHSELSPSGTNRMVRSNTEPRIICQVPGRRLTAMERTSSKMSDATNAPATEPAPARMVTKTKPPDVVQ